MTINRGCLRCGEPIGACFGFQLARDTEAAMRGALRWTQVREHCGNCVEWMWHEWTEEQRMEYLSKISFPNAALPDHGRPGSADTPLSAGTLVHNEFDTLKMALAGRSIARFGDGELRLALGGTSVSQDRCVVLAEDLRHLLKGPTVSLVCIPRLIPDSPKLPNWQKYHIEKWKALYRQKEYGSAFVTRPDSAPCIDTDDYWRLVLQLWHDKDVTLVIGSERSLLPEHLVGAKSVRVVRGSYRDAYTEIDRLTTECLASARPGDTFLLCLGAAATVLAERLARKGMHALDLGHIGRSVKRWVRNNNVGETVSDTAERRGDAEAGAPGQVDSAVR